MNRNGGGNEVWALDEICIGTYKGKPLYQKCMEVTSISTVSGWIDVLDLTSLNIDKVVYIYGTQYRNIDPYYVLQLDYAENCKFCVRITKGKKMLANMIANTNNANIPCVVRLMYTKTTDT